MFGISTHKSNDRELPCVKLMANSEEPLHISSTEFPDSNSPLYLD